MYDPKSKQYAHPAGLVVATPSGRLARYIYGVDFPANNLRWSLIDASAGKIGTPVDRLLLMCFHYDPSTGRYNFAVMSAVRAARRRDGGRPRRVHAPRATGATGGRPPARTGDRLTDA